MQAPPVTAITSACDFAPVCLIGTPGAFAGSHRPRVSYRRAHVLAHVLVGKRDRAPRLDERVSLRGV